MSAHATIHFVFFQDCPTAGPARQALDKALAELDRNCEVIEVDTTHLPPDDPMTKYPSPTILVNGSELFAPAHGAAACCRVLPTGALQPRVLAASLRAVLDKH